MHFHNNSLFYNLIIPDIAVEQFIGCSCLKGIPVRDGSCCHVYYLGMGNKHVS